MIGIVVPMAGLGTRFGDTEQRLPKPLINVLPGQSMIDFVIDYLRLPEEYYFVFVALREHDEQYHFRDHIKQRGIRFDLALVDRVTRGPAATTLAAKNFVRPDDELLVAYCDLFLDMDVMEVIRHWRARNADGGVFVYPSSTIFESYAAIDVNGLVSRTAEKEVISPHATAGLYYFKRSHDYFDAVERNLTVLPVAGPEVFVCPMYNNLIANGKRVLSFPLPPERRMEMGTPSDLAKVRAKLRVANPLNVKIPSC